MAMETVQTIELQGPLEIENIQIPFEDETLFFNIEQEVARVIDVTSWIADVTQEVNNDKLYVKGTQKIDIVYQANTEEAIYSKASVEKPFESYIDLWANCLQPIDVEASVTHCHVFVSDIGKLSGNGGVNLKIRKRSKQEIPQTELVSDSIQVKQKVINTIKQTTQEMNHITIREGIELSEDVAPIGTIIKASLEAKLLQYSVNGEKLYLEGDLCLKVLYEAQESEGNTLEYYMDEHIPFSSLVKCEVDEFEQQELLVKLGDITYSTEARPDFRGENRFIQFTAEIDVYMVKEIQEEHTIVEDLYDLNDPKLNVTIDNISYVTNKEMIEAVAECNEIITIEEEATVSRILDTTVSLGIIRVEPGNGYCAKQCGCINILYLDEVGCIQVIQKEMTWEITSEECDDANLYNVFSACIKEMHGKVSHANELQVTFKLVHKVEAFYIETCAVVTDSFEEECAMPKPGLYVCFTEQDDTWEIAKKFKVKQTDVFVVDSEAGNKRVVVSKKMY